MSTKFHIFVMSGAHAVRVSINGVQFLARLVAPPACVGCGGEGSYLCPACEKLGSQPPYPACFGCDSYNNTGVTCWLCQRLTSISGLTVGATYDGSMRELIQRLKYQRQREIAGLLAARLTPLLDAANFDVITGVPVATNRLRSRGYNQAERIGRELSRSLRLPYRPLLRRMKNTRQVGSARSTRLQQAGATFGITARRPPGSRILLVDDVVTTGATLNACARLLARHHNVRVWVAVGAKAERN